MSTGTKQDLINRMMIGHETWQTGYTRKQLEGMSKEELEDWLYDLKLASDPKFIRAMEKLHAQELKKCLHVVNEVNLKATHRGYGCLE